MFKHPRYISKAALINDDKMCEVGQFQFYDITHNVNIVLLIDISQPLKDKQVWLQ